MTGHVVTIRNIPGRDDLNIWSWPNGTASASIRDGERWVPLEWLFPTATIEVEIVEDGAA